MSLRIQIIPQLFQIIFFILFILPLLSVLLVWGIVAAHTASVLQSEYKDRATRRLFGLSL